ncbi:MAG: type II secretion system protein GspK [SAR324 cluster bacterium]|nr:type II secretion system protein GspK [SAR324 cluster bacterium]
MIRKCKRPAGIALMLSLVVVVLLTAFISEFFFATGLELRSMQTFKEAEQARGLARLAFKAAQMGLLNDEVNFFKNFKQLSDALSVSSVPWRDGLLVNLRIIPQDGLFNLNELDIRGGGDRDRVRWELFRNILVDMPMRGVDPALEDQSLPEERIADLYAALVDWVDGANTDYLGASGGSGAEADVYFSADPEISIKNQQLDRLSEIRLVRGVADSGLAWVDWERHFSALQKSTKSDLYPEKLNVNLATQDEIITYLQRRRIEDFAFKSTTDRDLQKNINAYADQAAAIAELLVPEDEGGNRLPYDKASLEQRLRGVVGINFKIATQIFSFKNEYYRVQLTTSVNEVDAVLEALIHVPRDNFRIGQRVKVLFITLN